LFFCGERRAPFFVNQCFALFSRCLGAFMTIGDDTSSFCHSGKRLACRYGDVMHARTCGAPFPSGGWRASLLRRREGARARGRGGRGLFVAAFFALLQERRSLPLSSPSPLCRSQNQKHSSVHTHAKDERVPIKHQTAKGGASSSSPSLTRERPPLTFDSSPTNMAAAKRTWVYNKKFGNTTLSALA
jgi:hypothetical protein